MNTCRSDYGCVATFLLTGISAPHPRGNLTNLTFLPADSFLGLAEGEH